MRKQDKTNTNETINSNNREVLSPLETAGLKVYSIGSVSYVIESNIAGVRPAYYKEEQNQWFYHWLDNVYELARLQAEEDEPISCDYSQDETTKLTAWLEQIRSRLAWNEWFKDKFIDFPEVNKRIVTVAFCADKRIKLTKKQCVSLFGETQTEYLLNCVKSVTSTLHTIHYGSANIKQEKLLSKGKAELELFYSKFLNSDMSEVAYHATTNDVKNLLGSFVTIYGTSKKKAVGTGSYSAKTKKDDQMLPTLLLLLGASVNGKLAKVAIDGTKATVNANTAKSAKAEIAQEDSTGESAVQ